MLLNIENNRQYLTDVKELYYNSFPIEERRPWKDVERLLQADCGSYNLKVIIENDDFAGFISYWHFGNFCYVEHFAIKPQLRGNGVGAMALQQLISHVGCPVVLEVELPCQGETARRRVAFYHRNGFTPHYDFEYLQPPYADGLPSVPLMLMTANATANVDLKSIVATLHQEVYGIKS